jgi:hypothetical protein
MMGDYPDPAERDVLRDEEEVVASLMGQYIAQRERGAIPLADELLAQAAEFGPRARINLEDLIVLWELHRLSP